MASNDVPTQVQSWPGELLLRALWRASTDAKLIIDERSIIRFANPALQALFGYTQDGVIGEPLAVLQPERLRKGHQHGVASYLKSGKKTLDWRAVETCGRHRDGHEIPIEISFAEVNLGGERFFAGSIRDVTERVRAETALKGAISQLSAIIESTTDGVLVVSTDNQITRFNQRFVELWRIPPSVLDSKDDDKAIAFVLEQLRDPEAFLAKVNALKANPLAESFDVLHFKDGRVFERYSRAQLDAETPIGRVWSFRDVTVQVHVEEELQRSNTLFQAIQATSHVGGWEWDVTADTILWTDETYHLFETTREQYTPRVSDIGRFFDSADGPAIRNLIRGSVLSGQPFETEVKLQTAKGRDIWVHTMCSPTVVDGRSVRLTGAFQDISENKRAQETLSASEQRYRTLVEHSPYCIHEIDRDGRLTSMNASGLKMMGLDDECAVQAKPYLDSVCDRDRARVAGLLSEALSGNESEFVFQSSNGLVFQSSFVPITDETGAVQRLMGLTIDISAQRQAEQVQSALYKISNASHESSDLDDLYRRIHAIIGELMPARNFYIALLDEARDAVTFEYWADEADPRPMPLRFSDGKGLTCWLLRAGQPLLLSPDSVRDGSLPEGLSRLGPDSIDWLGVPLKEEDRTIGMLAVQSYSGDFRYGQEHLELLRFVSDQIAAAIGRKRQEDAVRKSEGMFRAIFDKGPVYITLIELPEGRFIEVNDACLAAFGYSREDVIGRTTVDFGAWAKPEQRDEFFRLLKETGSVNNFEAEMLRKDRTPVNVLFTSKRISVGGGDFVLNMLQDITERRQLERLQSALFSIFNASQESNDLDDLYRRIHAIIGELMPARNFYIALLDEARDKISFVYWADEVDPRPEPRRFSDGGGLTNWVLKSGHPLLLTPDSVRDSALSASIGDIIGTDSIDWLGIPLTVSGKTIGMLAVQSYTGDVHYERKHLELLQFVSGQIATTVERKRTEQALRDNEEKFRRVFDQSPSVNCLLGFPSGEFIEVNEAGIKVFGYTREEIIGRTSEEMDAWVNPEDRDRYLSALLEYGVAMDFEAVFRRKNGEHFIVLINGSLITLGGQKYSLNSIKDITESKRDETLLRESEEQFKSAFENSAIGIALVSLEGRWLKVNPSVSQLTGYSDRELLGMTFQDITHPDDLAADLRQLNALLAGEINNYRMEKRYIRKDGDIVWVLLAVSLVRDVTGQPKHFISQIEDITETKRAIALLRESQEQFKSAFEDSALGIALVALDGTYLKVNASVCTFTGYDEQELLGMTFADITHPDDLETERKFDRKLLASEIENYRIKKRYFRKDGNVIWVQLAVSLVRDESGQPRHFISQIEDISATVQAQRSLEEANRSLAKTQHLLETSQYAAQVGGWELDLGSGMLYWTAETYRLLDLIPGDYTPSLESSLPYYKEDSRVAVTAAVKLAIAEGTPFDLELQMTTVRGRHLWLRVTGQTIKVDGRTVAIGGAAQDITERKHSEQWQQHYSHILALITAETSLPTVLDALARFIELQSEGALCSVLLMSPDGKRLTHGAAPSLPGFFVEAVDGTEVGPTIGTCGAAAALGHSVLTEDIQISPNWLDWRALAAQAGLKACWSVPIFSADHRVVGTFAIYQRDRWSPTPDEEELVSRSASLAALAIDRARHQEAQRLAKTVFEENVEGVMVTSSDARILMVNPAFERLTGYSAAEAVGQAPTLLDSGRHDEAFWTAIRAQLAKTGHWEGEVWHRRKNGEIYPVQMSITDVHGDDGAMTQRISIMTDVSQQMVQAARIEQLAFYDPLTGLPNRALFLDRLENILASSERRGDHGAILFMDLDRFKEINDSKGHAIGDLALAEVSRRFLTACRREETLARLGGDEFVLIAEGADHRSASLIASRLLQSLSEPLLLLGVAHPIGTSVGIAFYPADGTTSEELIKHTDIAMYRAKAAGGGYRFYQAEMSAELEKRLMIAQRLGAAMDADELLLYYQPKIELTTGKLVGAEALLRWQDPDLGWISPADFIPVAEQRGMMSKLGDWVLREGCRQLVEWRTRGMAMPGRLSINVSAQQIEDPEVLGRMLEIVHAAGAAPTWLELELTESSMMSDPEHSVVIMEYLAAAGFGLSIDDFGTGYSSLSYLKRFSADEIKIDISFVRDMLTDPDDYSIVKTIIAMAHGFGMTTTAEGVEVEGQSEALKAMGCDVAQGYLYSRAEAPDIFSEIWLAAGRMHAPASSTLPGGASTIP